MKILTIESKKNEKYLRTPVSPLDFAQENPEELRVLIREMRGAMREARGVGLSANQVGVSKRLFIAQVPNVEGRQKFYAVLNPEIIKASKEKVSATEGCLSIPNWFGDVLRHSSLTLTGISSAGKKLKIKAWGLLARVFQHELDHLDGVLFIDKALNLHRVDAEEESREARI